MKTGWRLHASSKNPSIRCYLMVSSRAQHVAWTRASGKLLLPFDTCTAQGIHVGPLVTTISCRMVVADLMHSGHTWHKILARLGWNMWWLAVEQACGVGIWVPPVLCCLPHKGALKPTSLLSWGNCLEFFVLTCQLLLVTWVSHNPLPVYFSVAIPVARTSPHGEVVFPLLLLIWVLLQAGISMQWCCE